MISVRLVEASARRDLRRVERSIARAEQTALRRAGGNVRRAYIAGIRRGTTKALPEKVAPLDKAWRAILHPGVRQGGGLSQRRLWPILLSGHGVTVDASPRYRRTLAAYMGIAEGDRAEMSLRTAVSWLRKQGANAGHGRVNVYAASRAIPYRYRGTTNLIYAIMRHWEATRAAPTSWNVSGEWLLAAVASLPPVHRIPARPVVDRVRAWAAREIGGWYVAILRKLNAGGRRAK